MLFRSRGGAQSSRRSLAGASARSRLDAGKSTPAPRVGDPRQQPVGDQLLQDRHGGGGLSPRQRLLDVRHFFDSRGNVGAKALGWLRCSFSLFFSLSPFSSSFRSWLRAQDAGEAEKAKQDGSKWPGEPKTSPFSSFLFTMTGAAAATAQIYHIECGRFCYR